VPVGPGTIVMNRDDGHQRHRNDLPLSRLRYTSVARPIGGVKNRLSEKIHKQLYAKNLHYFRPIGPVRLPGWARESLP
jgi:hypothetical protein